MSMHPTPSLRRATRAGVKALACLLLTTLFAIGQAAGTGTLTGRVQDTAAGQSLEKARVSVAGTKNSHYPTYAPAWGNNGDSSNKRLLWGPGFDITYTVPLSKNFGFSINAVKFDQFNAVQQIRRNFSTTTLPANPSRATVDNPYLQSGNYLLFPITTRRKSSASMRRLIISSRNDTHSTSPAGTSSTIAISRRLMPSAARGT